MLIADTARLLVLGDVQRAAAYGLGMAGFIGTCLIIGLKRHLPLTAEQHRELNILAVRALAVVILGQIAHAVWGATVVGAPLVVTLTAVALITLAGDAAKIAPPSSGRSSAT